MAPKAKKSGKSLAGSVGGKSSDSGEGQKRPTNPDPSGLGAATQRYQAAGGPSGGTMMDSMIRRAGLDPAKVKKDLEASKAGNLKGALGSVDSAKNLNTLAEDLERRNGRIFENLPSAKSAIDSAKSKPKESSKPRNRKEAARKGALTRKMKGK